MEKADFEALGKTLPEGSGRDAGVEGEEEGGAAAANDRRRGNKSKASGGKSSGDGIGRALRDSAKDDAAFETHKLLCQIGSPDTKASSLEALKRFTKKRTYVSG
jgi:hypothetical protein